MPLHNLSSCDVNSQSDVLLCNMWPKHLIYDLIGCDFWWLVQSDAYLESWELVHLYFCSLPPIKSFKNSYCGIALSSVSAIVYICLNVKDSIAGWPTNFQNWDGYMLFRFFLGCWWFLCRCLWGWCHCWWIIGL